MINLIVYLVNATFLSKTLIQNFVSEFSFPLVCDILLSYCWSQEPFKGSLCRSTFLRPPSLSGIGADLPTDKGDSLISFPFVCLPKKWVNFSQFEFYWESKKGIPFPEPVTMAIMVIVSSGYFSPFELNVLIYIVCERLVLFPLWCCEAQTSDTHPDSGDLRAVSVVHLVKKCLLFQTSRFISPCLFTSFVYLDSYLSYVRNCLSFCILYCAQHNEVSIFRVSSGMTIIQIMNSNHLYLWPSCKSVAFSWAENSEKLHEYLPSVVNKEFDLF